jgi:outer membrane immunogenic protein
MRVLFGVSLGLAIAGFCVTGAAAQESVYGDWTGFYFGGQAGYGWGDSSGEIEGEFEKTLRRNPPLPANPASAGEVARDAVLDDEPYSFSSNGGLAGLHVGGNVQLNAILFGIEADYDWSTLSSGTTLTPEAKAGQAGDVTADRPTVELGTAIDGVATVRGRVGFATRDWVVYGTGGLAWAEATFSLVSNNPNVGLQEDIVDGHLGETKTLNGYVYGGGIEYKISRQLSLRGEVLHYDLGRLSYEIEDIEGQNFEDVEGSHNVDFTQVRAALSFHLN